MAEAKRFVFSGSDSDALTSFLFFELVEEVSRALPLGSTAVRGGPTWRLLRALE